MKKSKLPKTDSIQRLARFWDAHDLTEFEDELVEVTEPVFVNPASGRGGINVPLKLREARAVSRLARAKGMSPQELVRAWVLKKIAGRSNGRAAQR